ncbi:MAG: hypothetical protein IJ233_11675 [Pyramidobacter sp.]|nr:hypothetical protein [Pyramidobacter sp.]MBQ8130452.1 hypothetical protein [Clostridia bacterium]
MIEFSVKGNKYRASSMPARTQFHVVRRIGKALDKFVVLMDDDKDDSFGAIGSALLDSLGSLPDADADYIIDACLDTVKRDMGSGLGWADLRANGVQMYQLSLYELGAVLYYVLKGNLDSFFADLPSEAGEALKRVTERCMSAFQTEKTGSSVPPSEA